MGIYMRPDGSFEVRAPLRLPKSAVDEFVRSKEKWIREKSSLLRQRQRQAPYEPALAEAIPVASPADHSDLYDALMALDETLRLPVVLHYLEGFKTREVAQMLNIPEGTVKTRLRAARAQLRKDLEGACFA